jgi:exopolyphosphatase/guanosine-5'-triphosphate,3'-diphosphate pyrophosphatase
VNPLGDEVLAALPDWWAGPCVTRPTRSTRRTRDRVAAIDCGTNSIRLLVADVDPAPARCRRRRRMEIVRLGQGVDRTGGSRPRRWRARSTRPAATPDCARRPASRRPVRRDVGQPRRANRDEFVAGVRALLGVEPEVVPGDEEARLSFAGATGELRGRARGAVPRRRPRRRVDGVRARRRAPRPRCRWTSAACG